ncbi:Na+/H+ antiporter NhaA [Flavihumibacter petaseus]|uniref:Na(+)/H(+) antiporter NhaA n=1 Tax=Flavihumibacter petaseus NBRC 106054 TaxID=1220578 RepID=A0A0E9N4M8_9BACT|nr:Na+/H+ antiporter NhaA [Flavihumibacter petaseus]GAO44753.1 Na(+)/H(+) antiporter NhaA [Flavihumibacter petaseus NBRC 106054]
MGIVLLACTVISLLLANSSIGMTYLHLIEQETPSGQSLGLHLPHTLLHWINDGLMSIFFFMAGMEIKRELLVGELSSVRKASLPVAGAIGGMLVPAIIYLAINRNTPWEAGWGVPMATDIAFSLGVASLLSRRVPVSLKIFLMALAIIDDLGAILVIALFYGGTVHTLYLLLALALFALIYLAHKFLWHTLRPAMTIIGGILLWYCILQSGVHATIAGVLLAFTIPEDKLGNYVHALHDVVSFIILPLFALTNTAIVLPENLAETLFSPLAWGVAGGLVLGKPLGITLFAWMAVKLGWGQKPKDATWTQLAGIGALAGIGFTMSIFITMLAFDDTGLQNIAKLAILAAAVLSIVLGLLILGRAARNGSKGA